MAARKAGHRSSRRHRARKVPVSSPKVLRQSPHRNRARERPWAIAHRITLRPPHLGQFRGGWGRGARGHENRLPRRMRRIRSSSMGRACGRGSSPGSTERGPDGHLREGCLVGRGAGPGKSLRRPCDAVAREGTPGGFKVGGSRGRLDSEGGPRSTATEEQLPPAPPPSALAASLRVHPGALLPPPGCIASSCSPVGSPTPFVPPDDPPAGSIAGPSPCGFGAETPFSPQLRNGHSLHRRVGRGKFRLPFDSRPTRSNPSVPVRVEAMATRRLASGALSPGAPRSGRQPAPGHPSTPISSSPPGPRCPHRSHPETTPFVFFTSGSKTRGFERTCSPWRRRCGTTPA
jgi:hypothetical protein